MALSLHRLTLNHLKDTILKSAASSIFRSINDGEDIFSVFALYRFPLQEEAHFIAQTTSPLCTLTCIEDLVRYSGFVIAPFAPSPSQPILCIRPDESFTFKPDCSPLFQPSYQEEDEDTMRKQYHNTFTTFHNALRESRFRKLVLSRTDELGFSAPLKAYNLFCRACERYPRQFIALSYTPQSGMWLTATPEVLLENQDNRWHTVALAGTMPYQSDNQDWNSKNREEQQIVADYIAEQLRSFTSDVEIQPAHTVRAGDLAHLCTDFRFQVNHVSEIGQLLSALHPTPAVCGLAKDKAKEFIIQHEPKPRKYYAGFSGPFQLEGVSRLFVSLRCMQIINDCAVLHAGGGLLTSSKEEDEWNEIINKMRTMKSILDN